MTHSSLHALEGTVVSAAVHTPQPRTHTPEPGPQGQGTRAPGEMQARPPGSPWLQGSCQRVHAEPCLARLPFKGPLSKTLQTHEELWRRRHRPRSGRNLRSSPSQPGRCGLGISSTTQGARRARATGQKHKVRGKRPRETPQRTLLCCVSCAPPCSASAGDAGPLSFLGARCMSPNDRGSVGTVDCGLTDVAS